MHIPVLYEEIIAYLQPRSGGIYIDGTVGSGGHAKGILLASDPDGRLLAFDRDPEAISFAREQLLDVGDRVTFVQASYGEMAELAPRFGFKQVNGILLDLGLSSRQLEDGERGFSFMQAGTLDMRFDPTHGETAADLINQLDEAEIADILWRYGEMRNSRRFARAIVSERPVKSTQQLTNLVLRESGKSKKRQIHPATLVFQALRIAVNNELAELEKGLAAAIELLATDGYLAIISFHSLEDRMVKQFIHRQSKECICPPELPICTCDTRPNLRPITRKVVRPSVAEITRNPRSRSARLRVAQKLAGGQA
ncbi:MAG TPA: 16S rRNA (cytosine(1402)-N(4))-methyltransferase RsmH [Patescibacteria group bacterium]|jgi:16S rRNA (cytosine1402-N4)-methyltransferase|nr:16S rRNA (cytosine(1402)-N(4))-methyltransferase RsmH [Patescibacteria group bacterium]